MVLCHALVRIPIYRRFCKPWAQIPAHGVLCLVSFSLWTGPESWFIEGAIYWFHDRGPHLPFTIDEMLIRDHLYLVQIEARARHTGLERHRPHRLEHDSKSLVSLGFALSLPPPPRLTRPLLLLPRDYGIPVGDSQEMGEQSIYTLRWPVLFRGGKRGKESGVAPIWRKNWQPHPEVPVAPAFAFPGVMFQLFLLILSTWDKMECYQTTC